MTKEEKAAYDKKYQAANKEKLAAYRKKYGKDYRAANKEKIAAYRKVYGEANKEELKAYKEAAKDGFYTVYYLQEEHYVGMTTTLQYRLTKHKSEHNRHIEDVEIIGKYETKSEALRVEAALHSMGYLGRNSSYKQQTLRELI